MIEATDASKCDERQVKNKPSRLTHKKKGATHTMGNQGMKIWKLGAFFVISLMLVVGGVVENASAQTATVIVQPSSVKADTTVSKVTVTYRLTNTGDETVDTDDTAPDIDGNSITITLPTEFGAAYPEGSEAFLTEFGRPSTDASKKSYVTWSKWNITDAEIDTEARVNAGVFTITADMRANAEIVVNYWNVKVSPIIGTQIDTYIEASERTETELTAIGMGKPIVLEANLRVQDSAVTQADTGILEDFRKVVKMIGPLPSMVSVSPKPVKSGQVIDTLTVTYVVRDQPITLSETPETIVITLPVGWQPNHEGGFTIEEAAPTGDDAKKSYVVIATPYGPAATATNAQLTSTIASATENAAITIAVIAGAGTGDDVVTSMDVNDTITVKFYNVKVPSLTEPELLGLDKEEPDLVKAQLGVFDTMRSPQYTKDGEQIYGLAYQSSGMIQVNPPRESQVIVTTAPGRVKSEAVLSNVRVVYRTNEKIFGENRITIQLPEGWKAAHRASDSDADSTDMSFGNTVLEIPPNVDANKTSYVVLKSSSASIGKPDNDPNNNFNVRVTTENAAVQVMFTETIPAGNTITATFHGVRVPALTGTDLTKGSAVHQLMVKDSMISPMGKKYESRTQITVHRQTKSTVSVVTQPRAVQAGAALQTVKVTYKVMDMIAAENMITIDLPNIYDKTPFPDQAWGPVYDHTFAPGTIGTIALNRGTTAAPVTPMTVVRSLPTDADAGETSYVTVAYNASGSGRENTALVTVGGNEVIVNVLGDMMMNDTVVVTYYNVMAQGIIGTTPVKAMLSVKDKLSPDGMVYDGDAVITVNALTTSTVSVSTKTVMAEETRNIAVTYTARAAIPDNEITITLPDGWDAAYGGSFMIGQPATDRATTSYITLTRSPSALRDDISGSVPSGFTVSPGNMNPGNRLVVTFHNVKVPLFAGTTSPVQLRVTDNITGLAGTDYDAMTAITVAALLLGNVTVSDASVEAEDVVDLSVKYIATSALAVPDPKATEADPMNSTFGRIQVILPAGWIIANPTIYDERQPGKSDATYVELAKSGRVKLAKDGAEDRGPTMAFNGVVHIDVDAMPVRDHITLTFRNLKIAALDTPRLERYEDIPSTETMDRTMNKRLVIVTSREYSTETERDSDFPNIAAKTLHKNNQVATKDGGPYPHPTVTVKRKAQGEFAVSPNEATAGLMRDFTLTYKATEAMKAGDAIEIRLPRGWPSPNPYGLNGTDRPKAEKDWVNPHIYLSGSTSRFENTVVSVIDGNGSEETPGDVNSNGSIVRVALGKDVTRNSSIVLKYNEVTVQRHLTSDDNLVLIEAFSGPSVSVSELPQFPVAKPEEDKITVKHAANGSGEVTFEFGSGTVKPLATGINTNTAESIPAGTVADDEHSLRVIYTPDGDMGAGEFEIRLPSGWNAAEVLTSLDDNPTVKKSGDKITTVTAALPALFGESGSDRLVLTFTKIIVPKTHGNQAFVARSKHTGGSLTQLSPRPMAFVGNTMADNDAVAVKITPAAAYQNQDNVDFVIEITANGPMHNSQIEIRVPEGLTGLQTGDAAKANYVKTTATVGGVMVKTFDVVDETIVIETAQLNAGGKITVRLDNVNLKDVSADPALGFRVGTKTRGTLADLSDVDYFAIEELDGKRSIDGGLVRTVVGSGTMAVKPNLFEQGARNKNITLTFTATTDLPSGGLNLMITAPSFIETELAENTHVPQASASKFHADVKVADRLVVSGNTITWKNIVLRKGEKFVTQINRVNLREETGVDRWSVTLGGTALLDDDNEQMTVVGTLAEDVVFEIVDDVGIAMSSPSYPAASVQSIRLRFTTVNTTILPGGRLWFSVPVGWSMPSLTDRTNRATVDIVAKNGEEIKDKDGEPIVVKQLPKAGDTDAGSQMVLDVSGRQIILIVGAEGMLNEGDSVTVRYGDAPDPEKYPVHISASVTGTSGNDADGLAIHGSYRASSEAGFRQRPAGTIRVDVTNVEDGTGSVVLTTAPSPPRAGSTNNRVAVVYTGTGTMDGGTVRLTIPDGWGKLQTNKLKRNHIAVTVAGSGAALGDPAFEIVGGEGMMVEAYLKTFGKGNKLIFTYGGGTGSSDNRGAEAQGEIGEATFIVESKGSSNGDFIYITDADSLKALTIEVKGAASGSGQFAVTVKKNKAGEVVYDGVMERRIFAGDDKTYLEFTYTAEEAIAEGQLRLIVPSVWTAPQQDDTNRPGYTYLEEGNALVSGEEYQGQSVTATVQMARGDVIKIHYGWYDAENGGAHAPQAAGTYEFQVEFDGAAVASPPTVIVHGGTASKLVVTAPSTVSADPGAASVTITVKIQDDRGSVAVVGNDLEVMLSSTSLTGSFTDAGGEEIVDNTVTIPAGNTEATAYYSDTAAGTTATLRAMAVGLDSGSDTIEVTSAIDTVDANSISVSSATAKAGDSVTVTARGTAGRTATFSVGAVVTTMAMTESSTDSGSYSGSFNVVQDQHDGTHNVTVAIGDASAMAANVITVDTNAPTISASASPATVANGGMVTITATAVGATSVTVDVSALDTTRTTVSLTMANGSYSASITISDSNEAPNGSKTITVTATDAAGNSAMATAMVTLDNKLSYTSMIPAGQSLFHVPLAVDDMDTVGALKAALGDAVNLALVYDSAAGSWDARSDNVMITADLGIILATSAAVTHTFEGQAWGGGTSTISLKAGSNNLIGLPVNDPRVTNVSDIMSLFTSSVITSIVAGTGDPAEPFKQVIAGTSSDGPVMGDAAYLVTAAADATAAVIGKGWSSAAMGAAPVALAGYNVDDQTAVLDVQGAVVDEITGLAREGFRVKVKNLSTKASLSKVTSVEMAEGYNMTFVDLKAGNAARIGDVLEIYADSPNPLIGVKPVRHIVTVDDVKNSTIQLENLIAYEIPAETELLRNYPNPFNPETWIPYYLAEDADVNLRIYALSGELVRDIDVGHQTAAKYDTRAKAIYWDGRNSFGEQVASGVYFYSLSAGDFSATRKMVILK